MNKRDLIAKVAEIVGGTKKDAKMYVDAIVDAIVEGLLEEQKVQITGFGTFEARRYEGRDGHNPATGEALYIPPAYRPSFRAGKSLKDTIKENLEA